MKLAWKMSMARIHKNIRKSKKLHCLSFVVQKQSYCVFGALRAYLDNVDGEKEWFLELEHFCRIVDELDDDNAWDSFHDLQVSLLSIQNSNMSGRSRSPGHKYSRHLYFRPFFTLFGGSTDNCIKYIYELEYLMFFTWSSGFVFEHIWGQAMNSSSISGRFRPVFGEICFCCFGVVFVCFGLALGVFGTVHLPPLQNQNLSNKIWQNC